MYRHIFMGRFKDGISEETKVKELADMKHPYHKDYIDQTGRDYFQTDTFAVAQFEM